MVKMEDPLPPENEIYRVMGKPGNSAVFDKISICLCEDWIPTGIFRVLFTLFFG
jgi:hypothetical protein